jgi:peptidase E
MSLPKNTTASTRQIVALGGGGFSYTGKSTPIDKYILSLVSHKNPKICFVPTASGDAESYTNKFYKAFSMENCYMSHFSVFNSNHPNEFLLDQDIIYVGGGNTFNMLQLWSARGVDKILKKAYENGIILCGISAGSLCWFESGNTDSFGKMDKMDCLGLLPFSNSPHFNSEKTRRPSFENLIKNKDISAGYGVDENVALHFENEELIKAVKEKEEGSAYFISSENGLITEKIIAPENIENNF